MEAPDQCRKHERPIVLEDWQQEIVLRASMAVPPRPLALRWLPRDHRFRTKLPSGRVAQYEHPRWFFSNLSADIRGLLCATCDRVGVRWTQSNHRNIPVSHRHSVALLDEHVGPKT